MSSKNKKQKKSEKLERLYKEHEENLPEYHKIKPELMSVKDIGFSEDQNKSYRKEMEDGHVIIDNFRGKPYEGYFAVYDGHGGRVAVDYVEENLHKNFIEALDFCKNVKDAYVYAYKKTDYELREYDVIECGTTSATCYITEIIDQKHKGKKRKKLFTSNCGDARVILCRNGKAQRLSYDHKGGDKLEKKRIESTGGYVFGGRVSRVLAVSRSFGDHGLKKWVVCDPFYTEVDLIDTDEFIIIACDGVWDVIKDQEACDLIRNEQNAQKMAKLLLDTSKKKQSKDNISVIVVILKKMS